MNILFLTYSYPPAVGGVERVVSALAAHLVARGHRALVVTHAPVRFFAYEPGAVPVLRIRIPSQCQPDAAGRWYAAKRNTFNLLVMAAFALRFRADALSSHFINMDTLYARRIACLLRIPHAVTVHGSDVLSWGRQDPLRERYVADALAAADRVTAVARTVLDDAAHYDSAHRDATRSDSAHYDSAHYDSAHHDTTHHDATHAAPPRGVVIPNPVDIAALEALAGPRDAAATPYVLCAGRLSPEKRFETAIDALHALAAGGSALELRIAGEGPCAADLRARAAAGPAAARIRFLGPTTPAETARQMRSAAALVLSSEREGCPNVLLEAMALGTPILAADIPAVRELIEPGVTGTLFAGGDPAELANALHALIGAPERFRAMTAAARLRAQVAHAPATIADMYLALFARQP